MAGALLPAGSGLVTAAPRSRVAKAIDRALGDGVTTRNWATMRKLRDLLDAG